MTIYVDIADAPYNAVGDSTTTLDGTDNTDAFHNFKADHQRSEIGEEPVELTIPPGIYRIGDETRGSDWWDGIANLKIFAAGAQVQLLGHNGFQIIDDITSFAFIEEARPGDGSVTLIDTGVAGNWNIGDWIEITALGMQDGGWPPNHHRGEYRKIAGKAGGVLSFSGLLTDLYKTTYPSAGIVNLTIHEGGPAIIYRMLPDFDCTVEINGLSDTDMTAFFGPRNGQNGTAGKHVTFKSCTFNTNGGIAATNCRYNSFQNCRLNWGAEIDKSIEYIEFINCTTPDTGLVIQSTSCKYMLIDGCTDFAITGGSPKHLTIQNSALGTCEFHSGYGANESIHIENTRVEFGFGPAISPSYYMLNLLEFSAGTFRVAKGVGTFFERGIPGSLMFFSDGCVNYGNQFKILDSREDNNYWYLDTTLEALPIYTGITQPDRLVSHPCRDFTGRDNTSVGDPHAYHVYDLRNSDLSRQNNAPANLPLFSYAEDTFTGYIQTIANGDWLKLWGEVKSIEFTVDTPYTGGGADVLLNFYTQYVNEANVVANLCDKPNLSINLKAAGTRVITPSGVTGAQAGDDLAGIGYVWLTNSLHMLTSRDVGSAYPTVTIKVLTEQRITILDDGDHAKANALARLTHAQRAPKRK